MNILVACECSAIVREAFRAKGHDAWSCDLKQCEVDSSHHIHGDVLYGLGWRKWDMLIAHPPCTYLCVSGLHWNKRRPGREKLTTHAIAFAERLWHQDIKKICIENPVGCLSTRSTLGKPTQFIQPNQFGHDASKKTGLHLRGLPSLRPTKIIPPRIVNGLPRWANQTDSGQNKLGPSEARATERSRTYQGIADAMANQWGAS